MLEHIDAYPTAIALPSPDMASCNKSAACRQIVPLAWLRMLNTNVLDGVRS